MNLVVFVSQQNHCIAKYTNLGKIKTIPPTPNKITFSLLPLSSPPPFRIYNSMNNFHCITTDLIHSFLLFGYPLFPLSLKTHFSSDVCTKSNIKGIQLRTEPNLAE